MGVAGPLVTGKGGAKLLPRPEARAEGGVGWPYTISVSDDSPHIVKVGGEHALTATVVGNTVQYDWQGEWKTWTELHDHPMIKELALKSTELLAKAAKGMKGTKGGGTASKGGAKGHRA